MNGYTLANHFRKLRPSFLFSCTEADLFYELVALCNERNWPTEFQYSNPLLCATLGISEKSLINARNRLKQAGLLEFTSGHKRSPTVYRFLDPDAEIPLPQVSQSGTHTGSQSGTQSGSQSGTSINKEKTKRKTKPAAPAESAGSSGESSPTSSQPAPALPTWQTWLTENAPEVLRLKTPLTAEQWKNLVAEFGEPLVQEVLLAMQNHVGLTRKYVSANLTARDWCKRRKPITPPASPSTLVSFDPDALFGYTQSADDGLAQARQSPDYQRYLAELAQEQQTTPSQAVDAALAHAA